MSDPTARHQPRPTTGALTSGSRTIAALGFALGLAACSEERVKPAPAEPCNVSWKGHVADMLAACTSCHGGDAPAAGYDLSSYLGALGGGTDQRPNAIAADPSSRLLTRLGRDDEAGAVQGDPHRVPAETLTALERWIGVCELAALDTPVHEHGVLDPSSAQFHGVTAAALGWDLRICATCHGDDFAGGTSGASCKSCHEDGPTACDTCHSLDAARAPRGAQGGQRPYGVGPVESAHGAHLRAQMRCSDCHVVPQTWDSPGHIRASAAPGPAGADPAPAEITFSELARSDGAQPEYVDGACRNVYCHGATLTTAGGRLTNPDWHGQGQAACGTCHAAPPASHADDRCPTCHSTATSRPAPHVDGVLTIGATAGCSGCHGDARSPAPPRDLSGATVTTALGVGAHRVHVEGLTLLRGPVPCAACHRVPTAVASAGHIDTAGPAEVEPSLGWDRATETCATAWCHGPARPTWTSRGQVSCGTCHGVPPDDANHDASQTIFTCVSCHPRTVDAFGNILLGPDGTTSEHIDGNVDLP